MKSVEVDVSVAGIQFRANDLQEAVQWFLECVETDPSNPKLACRFMNTFTVSLVEHDPAYGSLLNSTGSNFADGMPVALAMWSKRDSSMTSRAIVDFRVRGPSFFETVIDRGRGRGIRHFFVGGSAAMLSTMIEQLDCRYPGAQLVGVYSPPFRDLDEELIDLCLKSIPVDEVDVVWVGLGSPKQDFVVSRINSDLGVAACGVGAAFDFVAGTMPVAPLWMQERGLEWLSRFCREPARLWRRYLIGSPRFVWIVFKSAIRSRFEATGVTFGETSDLSFVMCDHFDPAIPANGGIETSIERLLVVKPDSVRCAIVGIDDLAPRADSQISGPAALHIADLADGVLRVARFSRLESSRFRRFLPHSARFCMGLYRYRRSLPRGIYVCHRVETALFVSVFLGRRVVLFVHNDSTGLVGASSDSLWKWFGLAYKWLSRVSVRCAEGTVVFNEAEYQRLVSKSSDVVRGFNSYDPSVFRIIPGIGGREAEERGELKIVWVGRLESQKDPELLIDVVSAMASYGDKVFSVSVFGDGSMREMLSDLVDSRDLTSVVSFKGVVSPSDLSSELRSADVLLMTSRYEGSPTVLVESMACGTPVVSTTEADPDCVIVDGVNGYRVQSRRASKFVRPILLGSQLEDSVVAASVSSRSLLVQGPILWAAMGVNS